MATTAARRDESQLSSSPLRNDGGAGAETDDNKINNNVWWLRMTCFFFFAGLSCYVPFFAAHLQWIGLNLQEIGIINLTAGLGSSFGLFLANIWSSPWSSSNGRCSGGGASRRRRNCSHRSNLALVILLAAFCGAGLILVPRISERNSGSLYGSGRLAEAGERPLAEILCRPEGSALFFRKCGDSCELDAVTRTELVVSDCRFESQNRFPGNFLDWINRFALMNPSAGSGFDDAADKSEPERGDLPQKQQPASPSSSSTDQSSLPPSPGEGGAETEWQPDDEDGNDNDDISSLFGGEKSGPALTSSGNIDPYEYDYDENHRQDAAAAEADDEQQRHTRRIFIINNNNNNDERRVDDNGNEGVGQSHEKKKKKNKRSGGVANEEEEEEVSDEDSNHLRRDERERDRSSGVVGDINVDASLSHHLEGIELEMAEKSELPYISSPHICFSSHLLSTTTCHVFTGNNHLFRFNTSFYSSITHNGQCFYSLNYDDVDNQILSELRCRSNKPNHQVRCRAEGVKLRASVTERRNGTNGECNRALSSSDNGNNNNNFHLSFWLYLVLRTCGEAAVIGSVLLLRIVTLTIDDKFFRLSSSSVTSSSLMLISIQRQQQQQQLTSGVDGGGQKVTTIVKWWMWGLFGFVTAGPLAGWVADSVGFGIAFLLGSVMFALAAFCIALAPSPAPKPRRRSTIPGLEEDEEDGILPLGPPRDEEDQRHRAASDVRPLHRIAARDLVALVSNKTSLLILFFILFVGMSAATVPTSLYWYILDLGASRFQLGLVVSPQLIVAPFVLLLSRWLWKRCGHRYIFIIGLLLYSIRFLGYSLLHRPLWLIAMETLEPLCSVWMLLTAAARIEQLEFHSQMGSKHVATYFSAASSSSSSPSSWKINTWALIIVFHYSFGRGIGGGLSSLAAHHFGVIRVFVGAALVSLFFAACWFLWIHLKPPDKSFLCKSKNAQQLPSTTTKTTTSSRQAKKNSDSAASAADSQPIITTGQSPLPSSQQTRQQRA